MHVVVVPLPTLSGLETYIASSEHMENKCTLPCDRVGEINPLLSQPRSILKFFRITASLWKVRNENSNLFMVLK